MCVRNKFCIQNGLKAELCKDTIADGATGSLRMRMQLNSKSNSRTEPSKGI